MDTLGRRAQAGGRLLWRRYAQGIDVVAEPATPWLGLVVLTVALALVAAIAAIGPAIAAARRQPLAALRSE